MAQGDDEPWSGMQPECEFLVSVDFGSFGFASSYCRPGVPSHLRMITNWADNRSATELNKNLAALLIDAKTKKTICTGFEAEETYNKLQEKKEDDGYLYFQHFKPYLYSKDHLKKNVPIEAEGGNGSLPLAVLITKSLEAVAEHTLTQINDMHKLSGLDDVDYDQIFWILCVPAIWDEMSKNLMKSCAHKAKMTNMELGSEPVVSAFYVMNSNQKGGDFQIRQRDKIMILDCGGGTIDASCIEITSKSHDLAELHHGDGIRAGGLDIDTKFMNLLGDLLPEDVIAPVQRQQAAQWMRQRQEFVQAKFTVEYDLEDFWNVPFCFGINQKIARKKKKRKKDPEYKNIMKHIEEYKVPDYSADAVAEDEEKGAPVNNNQEEQPQVGQPAATVPGAFKLGRSNLKINKNGWLYLHEDVLSKIVAFVQELFTHGDVSAAKKVILAGGFANSKYLRARLLHEFPDKQFFTPKMPHLAVVRGALYWICQKKKLTKTRSRYNYGLAVDRKWKKDDGESRQKITAEGAITENSFSTLIVRNQEYDEGYSAEFDYWIPAGCKRLELFLYASEDEFVQYVFEVDQKTLLKGNYKILPITIGIDNPSAERRKFEMKLEYRSNGINLFYKHPDTGEWEKVFVDTTAAPQGQDDDMANEE